MQKKAKIESLEVLRIVCSIFVIAIHIFMSYRVTENGISYDVLFVESFTRCCVPVFFMMTGFFLFQREKTVAQIAKYLAHRIIAPTLIVLVVIYIFSGWFNGTGTIYDCVQGFSLKALADFFVLLLKWEMIEPSFWLWYIKMLVQIYFFYPILKYICSEGKEEQIIRRLYMLLCALSTMIFPTIRSLFDIDIPAYVYSPLPFYAFFYVLIGYEISLMYAKKSRWINWELGIGLYVLGGLSTYLLTVYVDIAKDQQFDHLFFFYEMLNVAVSALGLFIFALSFELKSNAVIERIASASFVVYLIHHLITMKLQSLNILEYLVQHLGILFGNIVFAVIVFIVALAIAMLSRRVTQSIRKIVRRDRS